MIKLPQLKLSIAYQRRHASNTLGLPRKDNSTKLIILANLDIVNIELKFISLEKEPIKLVVGNNSFVSSGARRTPSVVAPASEHVG
jgi:hypothetical protein